MTPTYVIPQLVTVRLRSVRNNWLAAPGAARQPGASKGGGWGGCPPAPSTIWAANARSLTLRFCDVVRKIANASPALIRRWLMSTPIAWSMTAREASEVRSHPPYPAPAQHRAGRGQIPALSRALCSEAM